MGSRAFDGTPAMAVSMVSGVCHVCHGSLGSWSLGRRSQVMAMACLRHERNTCLWTQWTRFDFYSDFAKPGNSTLYMQSDAQTVAPEVRQMPCSGDRRKHTHTQCSQSEMIETLHTYALSVKATKASGETPQSPLNHLVTSLICSALDP